MSATLDPPTLRSACQRVQAGDRAAFAIIVQHTSTSLLRLAARILGDEFEAQDVLQDSYLRALDALLLGRFEERAEVKTWLYRIVTNAALDALRAKRRRGQRSESLASPHLASALAAQAESSLGRLEARAALKELAEWLRELPEAQRVAIVLKELEGLAVNEIAALLEVSVGAAEQLLVRARAALRSRSKRGDHHV